jgi:23S rRNA U2552 (ribose-2'-O)-methylase RlmE/FtsJ
LLRRPLLYADVLYFFQGERDEVFFSYTRLIFRRMFFFHNFCIFSTLLHSTTFLSTVRSSTPSTTIRRISTCATSQALTATATASAKVCSSRSHIRTILLSSSRGIIRQTSTTSSRTWLNRQIRDPYVQKAKEGGYRARSAFKLLELNSSYSIIKKGDKIIDLGASPGGFSQVAAELCGSDILFSGKVLTIENKIESTSTTVMSSLNTSSLSNRPSFLSAAPFQRGIVDQTNFIKKPRQKLSMTHNGPVVIAVDLLPIEVLKGCICIQGDFTNLEIQKFILSLLYPQDKTELSSLSVSSVSSLSSSSQIFTQTNSIDVVLSDMAPSFSGDGSLDTLRSFALAWRALLFATSILKKRGNFLCKIRNGGDAEKLFRSTLRLLFETVIEAKPPSSRSESAEVFLVAKGYLLNTRPTFTNEALEALKGHGIL